MEDKNSKFQRWGEERKKGMLRYVVKSTLFLCLLLVVGRIIGHLVFGNTQTNTEFFAEIPLSIVVMVIVGALINTVAWYIKELKHRNGD